MRRDHSAWEGISVGWFDDNPPVPRGIPSGEMGSAQPGPTSGQPAAGGGDPKSAIQAILARYPPGSAGLEQAMPEIQAAFPGTRFDTSAGPKDEIVIPGYGIVDLISNAETGGQQGWTWQHGGSSPTGAPTQGAPLGAIGGAAGNLASREAAHAGSPGYQFIVGEAMRALENSASARGTLLTGGHMRDLQDRAAGLASTDFGNEFNRNLQLGQLGFNAANAQGGYGSSYGTNLTSLTTGIGNAQAAGTANQGAAVGGMLGNLGNLAIQGGIYRGLGGQNQGGGQSGAPVPYGWNGLPTR
jgi:hypothetical protein